MANDNSNLNSKEMPRIHPTPKSTVRRKRPRPSSSSILLTLLPLTTAYDYKVTWNFGPEDHFFCGQAWDDSNCSTRQNCRSGKSEECLGFGRGETCFKDTPCDSAAGGGHDFDPEVYQTSIPTFSPTEFVGEPTASPVTLGPTLIPTDVPIGPPPPLDWPSDDPSDHWFCGIGIDDANERCGIHCPSASECPVGQICYFGTKCDHRTHAPTPPPTHRPTNPPTPRPTNSPTLSSPPTISPTATLSPTHSPTMPQPTVSPTPAPTRTPTHGPLTEIQSGFFCATDWNDAISNCKMRCPSGEDPECPMGEYCFAYTGCTEERGYPNGRPPMRSEAEPEEAEENEDQDEECVELKVIVTADDWPAETSWIVTNPESDEIVAEGNNDPLVTGEAVEYIECIPKGCYEFTMRDTGGDGLCCDHGEGSYEVFYNGELQMSGGVFYDSDIGEVGRCGDTPAPVAVTEAPSPAPVVVESGSGQGRAPSSAGNSNGGSSSSSSSNSSSGGSSNIVSSTSEGGGGSSYRCIQQSLLDRGYIIDAALCSKFTDCYNKFIDMGDDWFCGDGEVCTQSENCGAAEANEEVDEEKAELVQDQEETKPVGVVKDDPPEKDAEKAEQAATDEKEEIEFEVADEPVTSNPTDAPVTNKPLGRPPTTPATPQPVLGRPMRPNPSTATGETPAPVSTPAPVESTRAPVASTPQPTDEPTDTGTTLEPSKTPTLAPSLNPTTAMPTLGPCDGEPCAQKNYCRSRHGFCGPDKGYCNEKSIWTKDCKPEPTPSPSFGATTSTPTLGEVTPSPVLAQVFVNTKPSYKKPSGGGKPKPSGGKGPFTKPEPGTKEPSEAPTELPTESPTVVPTESPTQQPAESDTTLSPVGSNTETSSPTSSPMASDGLSLGTVNFVSLSSDSEVDIEIITDHPTSSPVASLTNAPTGAPTASPEALGEMQENSSVIETNLDDTPAEPNNEPPEEKPAYEFECTGEPCDQDTWCRSIFGSCGPGFIYCNAKAIWTSSCRITHPNAVVSKQPGKESSSEAVESSIDDEGGITYSDAEFNAAVPGPSPSAPSPTMPELPKPTLPTITSANSFTSKQAFAAHFAHFATADSDEGQYANANEDDEEMSLDYDDDDDDEGPVVNNKKEKEDLSSSNSYPTMYDSAEYAKQWSDWAKQVQSSAPRCYSYHLYVAVLSLSAMLLFA